MDLSTPAISFLSFYNIISALCLPITDIRPDLFISPFKTSSNYIS